MKPIIALVQGDPSGIGPELLAKLLCDEQLRARANILVVSDLRIFRAGCKIADLEPSLHVVSKVDDMDFAQGTPNLLDVQTTNPTEVPLGEVSIVAGRAALEWFGRALDLANQGHVDGVCYLPFNKEAMRRAGMDTEDDLQWARKRVGLGGHPSEFSVIEGMWNTRVTSHVPLRAVAGLLTIERIVEAISRADHTLKEAGFERPRIAVAALNPHAGDGGQIGREEVDIIAPAVEHARALGIHVDGPFPSDTLYIKVRDKHYDCAVSMYHDQGQTPMKLLGFHTCVTVLGGLPFPATSPGHGTAFDIVGKNIASIEPSRRAFQIVCRIAETRRTKLALS